ncbi:MAG: transcription termination/antitermination protein NusA [Deltaproteobacteria bacterium]|nr:transcription termination/antitermination protein NusA [Deltaproteobacteria bacterium]
MQDGSLPLNMILDQVSRDKGIDKEVLVEAVEAAILTAAKRTFGTSRELEAHYNEETGIVDLFQYMTVVEEVEHPEREVPIGMVKKAKLDADIGEELGFQIFYREEDDKNAKKQDKEFGGILELRTHGRGFGRIAAQTAKQVIIQRVRDAERENIYNEYKDRKNEVIAGIVRRFERNNSIIVDLGRTEAVIPAREQTPRESYRPGDRVMAYVKDIDRGARGPQIILSRTDVGLLQKLFEMEVPEIYEGIVKIVIAAREPGARSKIGVTSRDADVDPVGACVGMRGSRVQAVVQELRGEKIDIVPWDRDPARFVCNAIQPAEVARVIIDEANGSMELVVPDDKLSLAIGRRGQNVRLASQLTGWKLDVISETKFREREQEAIESLAMIDGIDESMARTMYKLGFRTVEEVAEAEQSELSAIPGLGNAETVGDIQKAAEQTMEDLRQARIRALATRAEPITERERLLFIRGIGERTIELLAEAGYRTINDIATETDIDRLALNTGLGIRKARHIMEGVKTFLESETQILAEIEEASHRAAEAAAKAAEVAAAEAAAAAEVAATEAETEAPAEQNDTASAETTEASAAGEPEGDEQPADEKPEGDEQPADEKPEAEGSASDDDETKKKVDLDNVDEEW